MQLFYSPSVTAVQSLPTAAFIYKVLNSHTLVTAKCICTSDFIQRVMIHHVILTGGISLSARHYENKMSG